MHFPLRIPRMGLLLIGAERFSTLGEGTARGTYLQRKQAEAEAMLADCRKRFAVTFEGIVFGRTDVEAAIDAFTRDKVDFVLAIYLSWAEDFAWIRFLRDMPPVPVLFAHRMRESIELSDTHDDDEFAEYLCCGGLVGMQEASGDNARFARPMLETAVGTWPQLLDRAQTFGGAARARALLRGGTIGLLASYNEAMWSTYVDPYLVFSQIGPELRFLSVAKLADYVDAVPEARAQAAVDTLRDRYPVLPDVDPAKLLASVRASIAMEDMAEAYGLDLLVLNDIDTVLFEKIGLRPGFYPVPGGSGDMVIVPEGDIGGGIATYLLKLLTGDHVGFIEPFHIDLPNENFAAGHAGPNDYTDPRGRVKIARDVRFAKSKWKHAGAPFAWYVFPQGEMTMVHISQRGNRFLLVATRILSLPCEHFLATYAHGLFRPIGQTSAELFEKLLRIGVTQHYAIVPGNHLDALADVARLMDFEYYSV